MYLNVLIAQYETEELKNHFNVNSVQLHALNKIK